MIKYITIDIRNFHHEIATKLDEMSDPPEALDTSASASATATANTSRTSSTANTSNNELFVEFYDDYNANESNRDDELQQYIQCKIPYVCLPYKVSSLCYFNCNFNYFLVRKDGYFIMVVPKSNQIPEILSTLFANMLYSSNLSTSRASVQLWCEHEVRKEKPAPTRHARGTLPCKAIIQVKKIIYKTDKKQKKCSFN